MNSNDLKNIVTSFTMYKFLDTLTMPFIMTDAYRLGIIDAQGNVLKNVQHLNPTEKSAYNEFYQLVFSLKRLLLKVPDPSVRAGLTSVTSALRLISEQCESLGGDPELFMEMAIRELDACRLLSEEGEGAVAAAPPANSVGAGGIYGLKPEEATFLGQQAQKRHISGKQIFRGRKPNKYYMNDGNF
jgi:hypothetical protein